MDSHEPVHMDHVFLDVERFTSRPTEAQVDVVAALNKIVKEALTAQKVRPKGRILIPTGDGMCIALRGSRPYDLQLKLALSILRRVRGHNRQERDPTRQFEVRIGIDANHDNVVTDVNGSPNVAGEGINMAARIMALADGGNILVGDQVHRVLGNREPYFNRFKGAVAQVKHGKMIGVYQLVGKYGGLRSEPPKQLAPGEATFSREVAWYIGLLIKHSEMLAHCQSAGVAWAWICARDRAAEEYAKQNKRIYTLVAESFESTVPREQLARCQGVPWGLCSTIDSLLDAVLAPYRSSLEGSWPLSVTKHGMQKLQQEHPDIYEWATAKDDDSGEPESVSVTTAS